MDAATTVPRATVLQQRWFVLGLVLFFVACSVKYGEKVLDSERDNRSAFLRWRDQIQELDQGVDLWDKFNYPNPPIMVLLLKPLTDLPPLVGSLAWYYLKVAMALAAIWLVFRFTETPGKPWPVWAQAAAVLLSLRPIEGDLSHGNINLFILLLCALGLYCYRCRRDLAAGGCLALAIACKVTPALFVPYLAWKRSWKALAGCAVGLVLFFWVVPGLFLGFENNQRYLSSWYRGMIVPFAMEGVVTTEHQNQSLPGLLHRLLTDSPSFSTFEGERYVPEESHNLVAWNPALVGGLVKLCMLAFAGCVVWVCRNPDGDRARWQLAAEFALVFLGMLLFSERTWKHHCVTMLAPFAVLCYYLAACQPGPRMKKFLIAVLAAVALLMTSTSTGWTRSMAWAGKLAEVYGAYVWANLALTAALVVVLRRQRVAARQVQPAPGVTQIIQARATVIMPSAAALARLESKEPSVYHAT
jgi:hypothetical protein